MITLALLACLALPGSAAGQSTEADPELFAATFDAHWQALRDGYPLFELYGVDWDAERAEHRPRAVAAADTDEFAWELARTISVLPDPHVSFLPALATIVERWSVPDVKTKKVERRVLALAWPDESETEFELRRPAEPNLGAKLNKHLGERWLVTGRVGDVGYMGIRTSDPEMATLGPDGKMTTMLRAALEELGDCEGLILDFQGNGGGLVAASDPFLGNLLAKSRRYEWGNSGGQTRVIRPRTPRYRGQVVALVDERGASGGEWAARILRDAGARYRYRRPNRGRRGRRAHLGRAGRLEGHVQRLAHGRARGEALPAGRHRPRSRPAAPRG